MNDSFVQIRLPVKFTVFLPIIAVTGYVMADDKDKLIGYLKISRLNNKLTGQYWNLDILIVTLHRYKFK